jgi:chromosome segregation ATPase
MREALGRLNRVFGEVVEEPRRSELEREIEVLRAQLVDQDRAMSRLRMKQSQTEQSLTAEQRLYGELESSLSSLDRQLQKPGS